MNYKSPVNWFGGKYYMADKIINMFPEHDMYVEVFGGAGHILFKKPASKIDVYNDIYSGLYNFFRILRNNEMANELINKIHLTPYSREEFYYCRDNWKTETNDVEKVRMWYTTLMQSFSSNMETWSHSKTVSRRGMSQSVSQWLGKIETNLPLAIERLREVQVENMDFKDLLKKYDGEKTLFYLDPPYVHDTRQMTFQYLHEMENFLHVDLVNILLKIKGKCLLSGYNNEIYQNLVNNGWSKLSIGEYDKRSEKSSGIDSRSKGEEFIWKNFN